MDRSQTLYSTAFSEFIFLTSTLVVSKKTQFQPAATASDKLDSTKLCRLVEKENKIENNDILEEDQRDIAGESASACWECSSI